MDKKRMSELGFIFLPAFGIQIDVAAVNRIMPDGSVVPASLCNHNCTNEVGGYDCPAAFTRNKGIKPVFAEGEDLLRWIQVGYSGLKQARDVLVRDHFTPYACDFRLPPKEQTVIRESLLSDVCEVNIFGGEPTMNLATLWLSRQLKALGFRVNLTTTGRPFMLSEDFVREFADSEVTPHLLALSADDFDPDRLDEVFQMPLPELKAEWKRVSPLNGQQQKFLEGVYAARLVKELGIKTVVLFNMVLHSGNLRHVKQIISTVSRYLPDALMNSYPAQDSFSGGDGNIFSADDVQVFSGLVDFFRDETLNGNPNITKRLQYWLLMQAVLENCREFPIAASQMIAGHHIWQCYRTPGAGLYLQIGKGRTNGASLVKIGEKKDGEKVLAPGGYPGCYWNSNTVTSSSQAELVEDVAWHVRSGMQVRAASATEKCPGCSMPRLLFNAFSTELGMNPGLREPYLRLRRRYAGF